MKPQPAIHLHGVRQNNLKNIDVDIPLRKMTVITGLSGSGKSTLAFDTLYAEGQRRYIESLSTYTRQFLNKMPKPLLDSIENIPPAIALEQRNTVLNSRSTVATQTEILDYLKLLYSKMGVLECEVCHAEVRDLTPQHLHEIGLQWSLGKRIAILTPLTLHQGAELKKKTFMANYFSVLLDQGFRKIYHKKNKSWINLDEPPPAGLTVESFLKNEIYLLMDRLSFLEAPQNIKQILDSDTLSRFHDSTEQALHFGHEKVAFLNWDTHEMKALQTGFCCVACSTPYPPLTAHSFSYNSPMGACPTCNGFGFNLELSENKIIPRQSLPLNKGAVDPFSKPSMKRHEKALLTFCTKNKIRVSKKYNELKPEEKTLIWEQIRHSFEKIAEDKYKFHIRLFIRRYQEPVLCQTCNGTRFKTETLKIKIRNHSIADLLKLPLTQLNALLKNFELTPSEAELTKELYPQILKRLDFLCRVGVGYLDLSRLTKTLSGGEFQRIHLATHLGNGLCGTLYVLDEPTIGLHPHDTEKLITLLKELREQGNTLVVVEHEQQILKEADWIIEMGPEAGQKGGEVFIAGSPQTLLSSNCKTQKLLDPKNKLTRTYPLKTQNTPWLTLEGCSEHNLKNIDVKIPLGKITVVTGVSGSGKTTLVHHTLANFLKAQLSFLSQKQNQEDDSSHEDEDSFDFNIGQHKKIKGYEALRNLYLLDQKPIGKNSRSNPATYLKAWDEIRKIYAHQSLALARGYTPGYFSFNVDGGRCPTCKGEGEITVDMHFLAAIKLPCEDCNGKRFSQPVLDVKFKNKSISQVLEMTIQEACDFFHDFPILREKFNVLKEVGLGYVQVGQSGPTLSGGESQRLKIASVLEQEKSSKKTMLSTHSDIFILDEPTTGLHQQDVEHLLRVLNTLKDHGKTIVLIEHHLSIIANADWVIDLGPEGGTEGGHLVAQGTPEQLKTLKSSKTGQALVQSAT